MECWAIIILLYDKEPPTIYLFQQKVCCIFPDKIKKHRKYLWNDACKSMNHQQLMKGFLNVFHGI